MKTTNTKKQEARETSVVVSPIVLTVIRVTERLAQDAAKKASSYFTK